MSPHEQHKLVIERDRLKVDLSQEQARGRRLLQMLERIKTHDAHSYEDEAGTIHHPDCDPCVATAALENEEAGWK